MQNSILDKMFLPHMAIREDFHLFSGRVQILNECLDAVTSQGSSMFIYGARGVGKSSVAYQLFSILNGNKAVIEHFNATNIVEGRKYKCLWHECKREEEQDLTGMLLRVLHPIWDKNSFKPVFPKLFTDRTFVAHIKKAYGIDISTMTMSRGKAKGTSVHLPENKSSLAESELVPSLFRDVTSFIEENYGRPDVILFIDELDRLEDKTGLSTFIKSVGNMRFVLVGIANDISELVGDHESVVRKVIGQTLELPGLNDDEMRQIFNNASKIAQQKVIFTEKFIDRVISDAYSYPWITQQMGLQATKAALAEQGGSDIIRVSDRHFIPARKVVFDFMTKSRKVNVEKFTRQKGEEAVLEVLCKQDEGLTEEELRDLVPEDLKRWVNDSLDTLQQRKAADEDHEGIVIKRGGRYWFSDPTKRILYRYYLENRKNK